MLRRPAWQRCMSRPSGSSRATWASSNATVTGRARRALRPAPWRHTARRWTVGLSWPARSEPSCGRRRLQLAAPTLPTRTPQHWARERASCWPNRVRRRGVPPRRPGTIAPLGLTLRRRRRGLGLEWQRWPRRAWSAGPRWTASWWRLVAGPTYRYGRLAGGRTLHAFCFPAQMGRHPSFDDAQRFGALAGVVGTRVARPRPTCT